MAAGLVEQPQRAAEQGDLPPNRQRRHLPNRDTIIRLVGDDLAERTEEWAQGRRYLGLDILARSRIRPITDTRNEVNTDMIVALSA